MNIKNYNLYMAANNIDRVILKLSECANIEIRNVGRRNGLIQVKAENLEKLSQITEILNIEKDNRFYINRIAII